MNQLNTNHAADPRPEVSIGHVGLAASSFQSSLKFFQMIGMRLVASMPNFAILELRGGTHLVLRAATKNKVQPARFDLMVDDLNAMRERLLSGGYDPSPISSGGGIHRSFDVTDPSGILLEFTSSHVSGPV